MGRDQANGGVSMHKPRNHKKDLPKALARSFKNMSQNGLSHFTEIELQIEALQEAPNWGLPPEMVLEALAEEMQANREIIPLGNHNGEMRYTTRRILKCERRLLKNVEALRFAAGTDPQ